MADNNYSMNVGVTDFNHIINQMNSENDINDNPLDAFEINSEYYDIEDISADINKNCQYTTLHLNIQSLPKKIDKLKILLSQLREKNIIIDFIMLCETFLTDDIADNYELDGYTFKYKNRKVKKGGVGIYINDKIHYSPRDDLSVFIEGEFETIFVEVEQNDRNIIVGEIYRVPNTNELLSVNRYQTILDKLHHINKDVIIGTDQNFDYLKINESCHINNLLNAFFSESILPTITKPTRITHKSATLIDNIYIKTSDPYTIQSGIIMTNMSDHLPVFSCMGKTKNEKFKQPLILKHRPLNDKSLQNIKYMLQITDWTNLENMELDQAYKYFIEKINEVLEVLEVCAPEKQTAIKFIKREK